MASGQLELHDIHLPEPVSWWPLAPGWWILLILIIALTIACFFFIPKLIKKIKHQPASKLALIEFKNIQQLYQSQQNKQTLIESLSILLRRVCMTYDSRQNIASLTGQAWIEKLNALSPQQELSTELTDVLLNGPYKKQHDFNAEQLLTHCENWIINLPKEAER